MRSWPFARESRAIYRQKAGGVRGNTACLPGGMPIRSVFVEEAAMLLRMSRRTVYYRIRDGKLRTIRIGGSQRVLIESIEALVRERYAARLKRRRG